MENLMNQHHSCVYIIITVYHGNSYGSPVYITIRHMYVLWAYVHNLTWINSI